MTKLRRADGAQQVDGARPAPYVLQVKLQPEERTVVESAARASDLPTSTWARRELLRQAEEATAPRSEVRQEVSLASGGYLRLSASRMDGASPEDQAFVLQLVGSMLAYARVPAVADEDGAGDARPT